jgi:PncC family amidohydrolase
VRAGATVATAESLTGGLLSAALTAISGSSATCRGGVVAYATDAKQSLLGVPADLLAARGAVDADVARAMASGVRERFGATYGLATTGVAGPTEQDGKPVGTVFVAIVGPDDESGDASAAAALSLRGGRDRIRQATVTAALDLLRRVLEGLDRPR